MGTESGNFRETHALTVAAVLGAAGTFEDFLDALEARAVVVNGGASTLITGSITAEVMANDGAAVNNTFRTSINMHAGPTTPVVNAKVQSAALGTLLTALETASDHTTVTNVSITANIACST